MNSTAKYNKVISAILIAVMVSLTTSQTGIARKNSAPPHQGTEEPERRYNPETGRLAFISAKEPYPVPGAALRPNMSLEAQSMAVAEVYAPEFGLQNPARDLEVMSTRSVGGNRSTTRYQQTYQGVPILAAELIINLDDNGRLLSMNGEVSPELSLNTTPSISSENARETALGVIARKYQEDPASFETTEPELWIFDESLIKSSIRPVELVWRMDVSAVDIGTPIREMVLINAHTGGVSLHFNQIDTVWSNRSGGSSVGQQGNSPPPPPTPTPSPTFPKEETKTQEPLSATPITYYVSPTGSDSNSCLATTTPCQTINGALGKAASGDTVKVAEGIYTYSGSGSPNVVTISKSITLSGGWINGFSEQTGATIIDGENANNGLLASADGSTVVVENFIIQNSISTDSGAIYVYGANFTLRNSTLKNNNANHRGAGIFSYYNANLTVMNSTISGNSATTSGGGIHITDGTALIQNSTIAYNGANSGGGISQDTGTVTIQNSILGNNTGTTSGPDCFGTVGSSDHNIYSDSADCTLTSSTGDQLDTDPQVNATLTGTPPYHELLPGSSAIDNGNPATCLGTDQRGVTRPQGSVCDIGSYEYFIVEPPAAISVQAGSGQITTLDQPFGAQLSAFVEDSSGTPVSGATVTFTAPASGASGAFSDSGTNTTTASTDASGIATASAFTANATSGTYNVEASVSGVATPAEFQLENVAPVATTLTVSSGSNQTAPLNTAFSQPLKALVEDQFGSPLSGVTVTFTAPVTGASGVFNDSGTTITTADTDANGLATASAFTANATSGTYNVEASAIGVTTPAEFQLANGTGWYVSINGDDNNNCQSPSTPCATLNGSIDKATAGDVILIEDGLYQGNDAIVEITKNITLLGGWNSDFSTQTGFSILDGTGAPSNTTLIQISENANFERLIIKNSAGGIKISNGLSCPISVTATIRQSSISNITTLPAIDNCGTLLLENSTVSNNERIGIRNYVGTVFIQNSTIAQNANLYYHYDGGGISSTNGSVTIQNSILAENTGNGGIAQDCSGDITSSGHNIIGTLSGCSVTSQSSDFTEIDPMLGMLLTEGYHRPLPGSPAIDAGNPAAPRSGGTTCEAIDQLGRSRPIDGDNDTVATCDIGAYETDTPTSSTVTYVEISSGSPQFTVVNTSFNTPLVAIVKDQYGLPVSGVDVTFAAPNSGASGIFSGTSTYQNVVTTDSNGLATASTFTANSTGGIYIVEASASGVGTPAAFQMENYVPVPTTLSVSDGSPQEARISTEFQNPLSGLLVDQKDQPIQGITVTFTAPSSGASGTFNNSGTNTITATTDSDGIATSEAFTANATEGAYTVDATVSGIGTTTEFQLENYEPIPTTITKYSGDYQSTTIYTAFSRPLEALVGDQFGNPMQGIMVTFTAAPSISVSPSGAFSDTGTKTTSAVTGVNGIATSSTFIANGNLGVHYVGATVNGLGSTVSFRFENKLGVQIYTYTMNHNGIEGALPGTFLCGQTYPDCTSGTNPDADLAHEYAFDTYLYYLREHSRRSIDNSGIKITSSVQFDTNYENAFWNGSQMVYGDNMITDDIAAHEMTHGVTQYESNLIYLYQSGAINESFSDLWGEFVDQTNGAGNDAEAVKWLIGEDLSGGAFRSMSSPPAYGDPDKISSPYFHTSMSNNGGVHTNSGINNKAVYLMVEGGSFNGKTITGIGINKIAAIYYEVQTNLLGAGANYTDLYYALSQACFNLVGGADGIISDDCTQVKNAAEAVEMHIKPSQSYTPMPDTCSAGFSEDYIFFDDMESGTGNWVSGAFSGSNTWGITTLGIASPSHSLFGENISSINDSFVAMTSDVNLPANSSYKLFFKHVFELEGYYDQNYNLVEGYDGGIVEYSTNQGASWSDARPLLSGGQDYTITLQSGYGNPLSGRAAFSGLSHSMVGSLYNLSSLAGQNVRFRWRIGSDNQYSYTGWFVDDISIYMCVQDISPTVSSIVRADVNPSNASSVAFTVTFSESVIGVDAADFRLVVAREANMSPGFITNVSGSGDTYTITVDTGEGSSLIRLDVVDDDTIVDSAGNMLGGTGTGNGDYLAGETYKIEKISDPPPNGIPLILGTDLDVSTEIDDSLSSESDGDSIVNNVDGSGGEEYTINESALSADSSREGHSETILSYSGQWRERYQNGPWDLVVWANSDEDGSRPNNDKIDVLVYNAGVWRLRSPDGAWNAIAWGEVNGNIPVPYDYANDGQADVSIYRSGIWWLRNPDGTWTSVSWRGLSADIP